MIVCMLLGKTTEVWQLLNELQALVDSHALKFQGGEAREWALVISDITAFLRVRRLLCMHVAHACRACMLCMHVGRTGGRW